MRFAQGPQSREEARWGIHLVELGQMVFPVSVQKLRCLEWMDETMLGEFACIDQPNNSVARCRNREAQ